MNQVGAVKMTSDCCPECNAQKLSAGCENCGCGYYYCPKCDWHEETVEVAPECRDKDCGCHQS